MTEFRDATDAEQITWQDGWQARLQDWYGRPDVPAAWAAQQVAGRVAMQAGNDKARIVAVTADGTVVGMLAVALVGQGAGLSAMVNDVWISEQNRRQGYGAQALRLAEDWARGEGARTVWVVTDPAQPAHAALVARYPVRAQHMIRDLTPGAGPATTQLAAGLEGRPMTRQEFSSWRAKSVAEYATEMAESGSASPEEAEAASVAQFDQTLPDGLETADHRFLCLEAGGEVVATNWILHHRNPGTSFVYGVEVSEGHRGKGYGRAAMVIGEQATLDAGDTHLALNVFGHNAVAISMYEAMGYRAYDHGRSADL